MDLKFIDQLDRDKMEIMVNDDCIFDCPHKAGHYAIGNQFVHSTPAIPYENGAGVCFQAACLRIGTAETIASFTPVLQPYLNKALGIVYSNLNVPEAKQ